ncbi:MAG: universal stress protein [Deltaproteobacteria bacterium]|nr:universal stress protein [Deltaproteobacteria bacterium]
MIPPKKILCPTDFSEPSYDGLAAAVELATHFSADLTILHVVSAPQPVTAGGGAPVFDYAGYLNEMTTSAENGIEEMIRDKVPEGLPVSSGVLEGNPADQIVAYAKEHQIDMIVMATHGLTGWRRFIFGSEAEKVVRLSECPVLTIPAPDEDD